MMEYLRSYEVSVWTLQDSFITVLKPSNLEHKGQIMDATMSLKDDGDNKFSLKIPMYITNDKGEIEENPLWYNTRDNIIIANLRKLKVIFNKKTKEEEIYEFLIINVEEIHDGFTKYCQIDCEGLAFNELGKQGFKISLNGYEDIRAEEELWFKEREKSEYDECPEPNINYWVSRVFKGSNWRYSIQMDWSAHDGITHQIYTDTLGNILDSDNYSNFTDKQKDDFNIMRKQDGLRRKDRIYEDSFVSSWKFSEDTGKLEPETVVEEKEKYRLIESDESNRYNLSQTIAEKFEVFCKYKYYYDDNYHIIDREVIFYNNFLNEKEGVIDLTYKYNTEHLTRKMESADLITKMFVKELNDKDMVSGKTSISDTSANKSLEDYIFNFDYMRNIGTISKEQYEELETYQTKMHEINLEYNKISSELEKLEEEKRKQQVREKNAKDEAELSLEEINKNTEFLDGITKGTGVGSRNQYNPEILYLIPDPETNNQLCYSNVKTNGIKKDTLHLYYEYDNKKFELKNELSKYSFVDDEAGNLIKISNIKKYDNSYIYAIFDYDIETYYNNLIVIYGSLNSKQKEIALDAENKLKEIENNIQNKTEIKEEKLKEKQTLINEFERFMGPALREGQWQPEEDYAKYGELHNDIINLSNPADFNDEALSSFGWDSELFDEEKDCKFYYGITMEEHYYPCIKINSNLFNNYTYDEFKNQLTFVYSVMENDEISQKWKQYMSIGSKMVLAFIRNTDSTSINYKKVFPVLMLTETEAASEEQLQKIEQNGHLCLIDIDTQTGEITEKKIIDIKNKWLIKPTEITNTQPYEMVYPRLKINSDKVKSYKTDVLIKRNNSDISLANYEDFSILPRDLAYFITLKPYTLLYAIEENAFNFNISYSLQYSISMTALAVYLDAIEILKENSQPKVSYEIDVTSIEKKLIYNLYQRLGQIAHINDYEFKFDNVMGYISELNLNLDRPWEDKIVIKNYKTKFEDLFSTIVAQTEQMKKNSSTLGMISQAFNNNGTLSDGVIENIVEQVNYYSTLSNVVSPTEDGYKKYETYIKTELRQVYNEAGKILAAAQNSINDVDQLNIGSAEILSLFKTNIRENMTPTNFIDENGRRYNKDLGQQTLHFKVGDIWTRTDGNVYTATENSHQVIYEDGEDKLTSLKGWSLIKNGSLAQIKGASLDINSDSGKISILAQNEIKIESGGELFLAGENVKILGNNSVDISGPTLNIYSVSQGQSINTSRGIRIWASTYGDVNERSAVEITGAGVKIGSAGKIDIYSKDGINIFTSDNSSTSAIKINRNDGIYLGSNQPIILYSGEEAGDSTKASVEISISRILFGVTGPVDGTAVRLTEKEILFGAGPVVRGTNPTSIGITQTGIQITKDYIKMASGNEDNRSYFILDKEKIEFGLADKGNNKGSFLSMNKNGQMIIGVSGTVITDSTGWKHTDSSKTNARFEVYSPHFIVDSDGHLFTEEATVKGNINATGGQIANWKIEENKISSNSGSTYMSSNTSEHAFCASNNFYVNHDGTLYASGAKIEGTTTISANKVEITGTENGKFIVNMNNFKVDSNGNVEIIGKITATAGGKIGGWTIGQHSIYIGKSEDANFTYIGDNTNNAAFYAGKGAFYVQHSGYLYAKNAFIEGSITATSGTIGGCKIDENGNLKVTSAHITSVDAGTINAGIISADRISAHSISIDKLAGSTKENNGWKLDFGTGNFSIGNISADNITSGTIKADLISGIDRSKITGGPITNGDWRIDFVGGTFSIGEISADKITTGTLTSLEIKNGNGFNVSSSGTMTCSGATIQGATTINTTSDITINGGRLLLFNSFCGFASATDLEVKRNLLLWIGAKTATADNGQTAYAIEDALFRVYQNGSICIGDNYTGGYLSVDTYGTNTTPGITLRIKSSGNERSYFYMGEHGISIKSNNGPLSLESAAGIKIYGTLDGYAPSSHNHDGRYAPYTHYHSQYLTSSDTIDYARTAIRIDGGGGKRIRVYSSSDNTPPTKSSEENRILWLHATGHKDFQIGTDEAGNPIMDRWTIVECLWKSV